MEVVNVTGSKYVLPARLRQVNIRASVNSDVLVYTENGFPINGLNTLSIPKGRFAVLTKTANSYLITDGDFGVNGIPISKVLNLQTTLDTLSSSIDSKVPMTRNLTIDGTTYDLSEDREWTISGSGVPTSRELTINGTAYDLSADRSWSVGTVTSVSALTLGTTGTDLSSTVANPTTTPVITLNVPTASASNRGALSSTDWSTFNSKEPAITWAQGDILYGTGVNTYSKLSKNTSATRYLSNTGTSNNPAWSQVDLTNGVTGVLPIANGGTGTSNSYGVCKLWYMDFTPHSLTGTTTETSMLQIALPTNMTATRLRITAFFRCTSYTSGTLALRLRLGTNTGSPTSNTQVAQVALGAANGIPLVRNYTCTTNLLEGVTFTTNLVNDEAAASGYASAVKDWTTQQYLFATIALANIANVAELSSIQILQTDY